MVTDANYNYCGDHFTIYINTESCCTLETNLICQLISQLKKIPPHTQIKQTQEWCRPDLA